MLLAAVASPYARSGERQGRSVDVTPETFSSALSDAKPGDTLSLADGAYKGGFSLKASGEQGAYIEIRARGADAVVDASGCECGLWLDHASWVKVEGISFRNATRYGLLAEGCTRVEIRNCTFALNSRGIQMVRTQDGVIEGCDVSGCTRQGAAGVGEFCKDLIIRGNRVHDNDSGAFILSSDLAVSGGVVISGVLFENNVICDNGVKTRAGAALILESVQKSTLRNNLFYGNGRRGIAMYATPGVASEGQGSSDNRIYNNLVHFRSGEGERCLWIFDGSTGNKIKNNIFIGGTAGVVYIEPSCFDGTESDYNVIANHRGDILIGDSSEGAPEMIADWLKRGFDKHSRFAVMPAFADPATGDFRLKPGSVGIDMGVDLGEDVKADMRGTPRPQGKACDCGCYETREEADRAASGG